MPSRRVLAVLLSAPLLMTTACGEAQRQLPNAELAKAVSLPPVSPTIGSPPPSPTTAAPTKAATASSAGSQPAPEAGKPGEVKALLENKFSPDRIEVKAGEEVTFINVGVGFHSVTGGDGAPDPASPIGDTSLDTDGKTIKVKFDKPGTYPYYCKPHAALNMKGQVVVS